MVKFLDTTDKISLCRVDVSRFGPNMRLSKILKLNAQPFLKFSDIFSCPPIRRMSPKSETWLSPNLVVSKSGKSVITGYPNNGPPLHGQSY